MSKDFIYNNEPLNKPLPSSPDSERLVIGASFLDKRIIGDCYSKGLMDFHFYTPHWRRCWKFMVELYLAEKEVSPITVADKISQTGIFVDVAMITNSTYGLPHFSEVDEYILKIQKKYEIREKIKDCNRASSLLLSEDDEDEKLLYEANTILKQSIERKEFLNMDHVSGGKESVGAFRKNIEMWKTKTSRGIFLPYPEVNQMIPVGLIPGDLSGIGARPSDGKTTKMVDEAEFIVKTQKKKVLIVSVEQSKDELIQKMVAKESRVANFRINERLFTEKEFQDEAEAVDLATDKIESYLDNYLFIDDKSKNLSQIFKTCNYMIEEKDVELIYIDFLQHIVIDLYKGENLRRDQELGNMTRDLKNLANTENHRRKKIHIRVLLQLNKNASGRKPTEADISESDKIYQTLDRLDCPYGKEGKVEGNLREMHLCNLKNRKGRAFWNINFYLHGNWQRFYTETMLSDDPSARLPDNSNFKFFSGDENI